MARKKVGVAADGSPPVESKKGTSQRHSAETPLRASALLNTRVIYCGDNLEHQRTKSFARTPTNSHHPGAKIGTSGGRTAQRFFKG